MTIDIQTKNILHKYHCQQRIWIGMKDLKVYWILLTSSDTVTYRHRGSILYHQVKYILYFYSVITVIIIVFLLHHNLCPSLLFFPSYDELSGFKFFLFLLILYSYSFLVDRNCDSTRSMVRGTKKSKKRWKIRQNKMWSIWYIDRGWEVRMENDK